VRGFRGDKQVAEAPKEEEREKMNLSAWAGEDVVMGEASAEGEGAATELKTGAKCARCSKRGHASANCTAEIYCVICDKHDHVNYKCPILKFPRPVAHAVGYAVHGLGFYHIPRPPLPRARKDARTALVSVEGGRVPVEEIRRQLERLFPGRWMKRPGFSVRKTRVPVPLR
jgi:hypothetical protein